MLCLYCVLSFCHRKRVLSINIIMILAHAGMQIQARELWSCLQEERLETRA